MKLSLLTKALLSALASTALLLLVFFYTQGGFGGASAGVVKKVLLPAGLGESRVTYGSDRTDRTYGTDGTDEGNGDSAQGDGSYYGQVADAGRKNDDENDHAQRGYYPAQRDDKQGAVLGESTTTSSASSNSSTSPRSLTPPAKVLGDSISLQPSAVDFSSLGISEYQLNQLIAQQLTNLASIGLLGSSAPSPYNSTTYNSTTPSVPSLPAPVITYIQPAPAQNFSGASLLSATDLSSTRFTTTTANVTDTATIKTLSVTENANVAGDLDVSGSATIDGDITITGNITGNVIGTINPSFTLGSIPFQGPSNLTQDNANLFWDNTNKRLGVGTSAPGYQLDLSRIEGAVINSNAAQLNIAHYADAAYPYAGIQLDHHSNGLGNQGGTYISFINNGTPEALIQFDANLGVANSFSIQNSTANGPLLFKTNGDNERMRVTSAGNVGIGTTGPGSKLHVNGNIQQTAGYGGQVVISTSALNYTAPRFGSGVLINGTIGSSGDDEASVIIGGSSFGGDNSYFNTLVGPSANTAGNINGAVVIGAYASHRANNGSGVAVGRSSTTDAFSVALGYAATITGSASIALGNSSTVVGNNSASFGAGTVTGASLFSYGGSATKHGFGTVLPGSKVEIKGTGATFATSSLNVTNSSGTSMFFVRDDGNVGIGTAIPAYKLDLGAGAVQAQIGSTLVGDWPALAGYAFIGNRALTQTASGNYALLQSSTGTTHINAATGQAINFAINNASPAMTVASTGNVGVGAGASGPGSKFAVAGGVTIGNDNTYYFGTAPTNGLLVQGNVGIGTTAPGKKFVINHNTVSTISFSDTNRPYWIYDYNNGGSVQWTSGYDIAGSNDFSIANIYSGTRDVFHIENAAPANAFRIIASSGNVGIGTTTPAYKLDVAGSISSDIGGGVGSYRAGGNRVLYSDTVSTYVGNLDASKTLSLVAGTSTGATILANGNVGIGTTTPDSKLHVYSAGASVVNIDSVGGNANLSWSVAGTNKWQAYTNGNDLRFYAGGDKVTFQPSGNVGIGTTTPGNRLVVVPAANEVAAQFTTVSGADSGFYITPHAANDVVLGSGAAYASAVFTAKATSASVLNMYAGGYDFYGDTGLTVGNTYTPTMRMTIKPGGNVGIGTTNPTASLHVANGSATFKVGSSVGVQGNTSGANAWNNFGTPDSTPPLAVYNSSNSEIFRITNAGNVGVGTTNPTQKLYVNTGAATIDIRASTVGQGGLNIVGDAPTSYAPSIKLYNASTLVGTLGASMGGEYSASAGTNDVILRSDVAKLLLQSGTGAAALTINTSNNVGIGTTTPGEKLHLVGNFKMNGVIYNSDTGTGFDVGGNQWKGFAGGQTIYDSQAAKILAKFSNGSVLSTGDSTVAANASLTIPKLWADQISATDGGGGTAGRSFTVKAGDSSAQPQYGGGNGGNLVLQGGKPTDNSLGNGGTAGYVAINTYAFGASSPTERMRIDTAGNVGIGTTNPYHQLAIQTSATPSISFAQTTGGYTFGSETGGGLARIVAGSPTTAWLDSYIKFQTHSVESSTLSDSMIIKGGNVGIGTTNPYHQLAIQTSATPSISFAQTTGGYTFGSETGGGLARIVAGSPTTAWLDSYIKFQTHSVESSTLSDSMIIKGGNVGIGTTTPSQLLHVYRSTGGVVARFTDADGSCDIDPTSTALVCSSDATLKKDITTLSGVLPKLQGMRGVSFKWKTQEDEALRIGVIAQEVEAAFPQLVKTDTVTGKKSVNYTGLSPILLQAVKEQQDEITTLQNQIASLQGMHSLSGNTPITFHSHLYLSADSVGQAKILTGSTSVRVTFDRPYQYQPVVTVTPLDFVDAAYRVTNTDSTGFSIELKFAAQTEVTFNWHAFASPEAKLTVSDGTTQQLVLVLPPQPAPEDGPLEGGRPLPGEVAGESTGTDSDSNSDNDQTQSSQDENENDPTPLEDSGTGQATAQSQSDQSVNEGGAAQDSAPSSVLN